MSSSVWYISISKKKIEFKKYPSKQKNKKTVKKSNQKSTNSAKKLLINLILALSLIFFLSVVSAAEINDTFHINLQTTFSNGTIETGTFTFAFNITENSSSSCGTPIVYNHSTSQATDTRGIVSLYLPTTGSDGGDLSTLDFDKQYYLCYYRDGTLKDVSQLGRVPYAFRATQVNLSEISVDSNLTLGSYNVSASSGFFSFLGSLVERITKIFATDVDISNNLSVGGNVSVTGNVTADWFIGDINASDVQNAPWITDYTETDPYWTGNQSSYSTTAEILAFGYYNASDFIITDYFTKSDILGFGYYNLTNFDIADYFTSAEVLAFNYYNASDFDIVDYFTSAQILGFNYYNSSDFVISDYYTKLEIDSFDFYNLSDFDIDNYYNITQTQEYGNATYIKQSEEANLDVNSSTWWAGLTGWISGWFIESSDQLDFNETKLNDTIDSRITGAESELHVNISDYWNTGDRGALRNISQIQGSWLTNDLSWINITDGDVRYILITDEPDLNVNRSEWWRTTEGDLDNVEDILGSWLTNDLAWINFTEGDTKYLLITDEANLNVNASDYWITDEGVKKNVVDILGSEITNDLGWINQTQGDIRYVEVSGDTMTGSLAINANLTIGTNVLFVDSNNNVVGIGTVTPQNTLNVVGDINATTNIYGNLIFQAGNEVLDTSTMFDGDVSGTYNVLQLGTGVVGTINLENGSVTAVKIAPNAVNTTHIVDGTILDEDIATAAGIQWSKLSNYPYVIAGAGLTGGGQLSENRTISISFGDDFLGWTNLTDYPEACNVNETITVIGNTITCSPISIIESQISDFGDYVPTTRTITAGAGLTGGGNLSADRSFAVAFSDTFLSWTNLTDYPEECPAGQAVRVIGDTLTCINISSQGSETLDGYDSTFFMPLNTSVVGNFSFNGGWTGGGLSIIEGDIYAQTGYFYNISSLEVTHLKINGSLIPDVTGSFDLGSSDKRWRDLWISRNVDIGGDLSLTGTMTSGTVPWARLSDHPYIIAGTGLEGGGDLSTNRTLSLTDTGVSAGDYGSTTIGYPRFTVDAQGRITSAANQTIRTATTSVTGITQLTASVTSTANDSAATPWSVKTAYDLAASKLSTETDPYWTANQSSYSTTAEILAFGYYNASDFVITDYFTKTDILGFGYYNLTDFDIADYFTSAEVLAFNYYNLSDFDIADYFTAAEILGFNYYNATDFVISDYYTKTEIDGFGFYNLSDFDIADYYTKTQVYNKTEVDGFSLSHWTDDLGDRGYTHLTNFTDDILWTTGFNATGDARWLGVGEESDPLWTGNFSSKTGTGNVVYSTSPTLVTPNIGAATAGGTLDMNSNKIISLGNGTSAQDAVTKSQLDSAIVGTGFDKGNIVQGTGMSLSGTLTERLVSSGNVTFNLANTAVTPGSYGGDIVVGRFTVDQQGRLTSASNTTIRTATTSVSGITTLTASVATDTNTTAATPWGVKVAYDTATAKASPGTCPAGQVVQNTTTGGVQCVDVDKASAVNGTGTQNTIAKFTGATTIGDSKITDDGTIVAVDTSDLYINTTSGNVGIGTTTPLTKLQIYDLDVNLSGQIYPAGNLLIYSSDALAIDKGGSIGLGGRYHTNSWRTFGLIKGAKETDVAGNQLGYLGFYASDNSAYLREKVRITSAGKVGIGTTTPQQKLHVAGNAVINGTLNMDSNKIISLGNGTSAQDAITLSQLQAVNASATAEETDPYWGANYSNVAFINKANTFGTFNQTFDTNTLFIDSVNDRVGIGTASPTYELDVVGNIGMDEYLYHNGDADTYYRFLANRHFVTVGGVNMLDFTPTAFSIDGGGVANTQIGGGNFFVGGSGGSYDGNVGIGTTSPTTPLHIDGGSLTNETLQRWQHSDADDGNHTILQYLDQSGASTWYISALNLNDAAHSADFTIGTRGGSNADFVIQDGGKVGIGTTNPIAYDTTPTKFHIAAGGGAGSIAEVARFGGANDAENSGGIIRIGTTNDWGVFIEGGRDATGAYGKIGVTDYQGDKTESVYIQDSGNVGIGTTTPQQKLHVNGSAVINGTLNMDSNKITSLGNGTSAQDAVTLSQLQTVNTSASVETDPLWTANQSSYSTTAEILAFGYYNASDFVITDYFTKTDILGFEYYNLTDFDIADYFTSAEVLAFNYYNASDFDIADYFTAAEILGFNYYNSSDFVISDYYTKTQIDNFNFYNLTDFDIDDYYTKTEVYNKTEVDGFSLSKWIDDLGDRGYTHLTNFTDDILWTFGFNATGDSRWLGVGEESDPLWTGNFSSKTGTGNVVYSTSPTLVTPNIGAATAGGTLNMNSNKIISLGNGTSAQDAVTLSQLQTVNTSATAPETDPYWGANYSNVAFINKANTFGAYNQTFDTSTLFIDSVSDRVGIGTTGPDAELDIRAANPVLSVRANSGASGRNSQISMWATFANHADTGSREMGKIIAGGQGATAWPGYMAFSTRDGDATMPEVMRLTGGNVGIGTTTPQTMLEISHASVPVIRLTETDTTVGAFQNLGTIEFYNSDENATGVAARIFAESRSGFGQPVALLFQTGVAGALVDGMIIDYDGNVGIGTTTPQNPLNVIGVINATGTVYSGGSAVLTSFTETDPKWTGNKTLVAFLSEAETISGNWVNTANPWVVNEGGTGAATLIDGGILLGSGTGAITPMAVLGNGAIVVGDGTTDPVALTAFTSSTGDLIHEAGGLEADVSGYTAGLYGMIGGVTTDIDTEGELETALGSINIITSGEVSGAETDPLWTGNQSSYWDTSTDLDGVISTDEITELKIDFNTVCGAGNHLYVSGNNLACEADDDTTYTASGTLLDLTGTTFSVNAGTLTTNKGCKFVTGTGIVCDQDYLTSFTETDPKWTGNYSAKTGTGSVVYSTSPTLVTPNIGAATAGGTLNMNNNAITNINWAGSDDGTGSGLDADKLDGSEKTAFQMDVSDSCSGENVIQTIAQDGTTGCYNTYSASDDLIDDITEWQGQCTNCVTDGDVVDTLTASNYVRKSTWTDHDNYPTGCGAGTAVRIIGDTLTCIDVYDAADDPISSIAEWQGLCTDCVGSTDVAANAVALTTDTTGNYAAGDAEAGAALTGDSAAAFFTTGTLEDDRLSFTLQDAVTDGGCTNCITDGMVSNTLTASYATNAGTLDSIDSLSFLRSDADDTLTSTMKVTGSIIHEETTSFGYIEHPADAYFVNNSVTTTGAIKVALPTLGGSDMISFWVDIFDYTTTESISVYIAGYTYQTNSWVNPTAFILSPNVNKQLTVRFGGDGSHNCVWIGELASTWSYPQVIVRDFMGGYSTDIDAYDDGWAITQVTSFDTVDESITTTFPVASDVVCTNCLTNVEVASADYATTAGGAPPTGTAAGALSGTYPNPGVDDTDCAAESVLMGDGACDTKASFGDGTGTVTSVAMTVPTGLTISGTPITTSGTLALSLTSGYSIPTTTKQTSWDTAVTHITTDVIELATDVQAVAVGGDLSGTVGSASVTDTECTTADQYLGGDGVCYGEYDAGDDLIGTIGEWDTACTDCVGNDDIGANSVDLTSQALSTAYAGTGIGGGGASALSFAAADVDGTCLTGSGTTLGVTTTGCKTNWDAAYTHISATGASHSYINQAVTTGSAPQFDRIGIGAANTQSGIKMSSWGGWGQTASAASQVIGSNIYVKPGDTTSRQVRSINTHASYGHAYAEFYGGDIVFNAQTAASTAGAIVVPKERMRIDGGVGGVVVSDHGTGTTDMLSNVIYTSGACSSTGASTTTIGTICVEY